MDEENPQHERFVRLFAVNEPAIRAFVRKLVPKRDDACDVIQEVAIALWRKFDASWGELDFRKFAFSVAHYEVLAWRRDRARDRHVLDEDVLMLLAEESVEMEDSLAAQRKALKSCLEKLAEPQRKLLLAAYASQRGRPAIGRAEWAIPARVLPVAVSHADRTPRLCAEDGAGGNTMSQREYWMQQIQRYAEGNSMRPSWPRSRRPSARTRPCDGILLELLNLDSAIDELVTTDDSPEVVLATDIAGLQAEADSAAPPARADRSLPQPPAGHDLSCTSGVGAGGAVKSPVLGFLGDFGRQGWGWVSDHTPLFFALALLLIVRGRRRVDRGLKTADAPGSTSRCDSPDSQCPKLPMGGRRQAQ